MDSKHEEWIKCLHGECGEECQSSDAAPPADFSSADEARTAWHREQADRRDSEQRTCADCGGHLPAGQDVELHHLCDFDNAEDRRERYAAAISTADDLGIRPSDCYPEADAAMAVADAEHSALMTAHIALAEQAGRDQADNARLSAELENANKVAMLIAEESAQRKATIERVRAAAVRLGDDRVWRAISAALEGGATS